MKNIIFILILTTLFSCKSKDEPKVFKLDPLATFSIKPASEAWKVNGQFAKSSDSIHLSALEIVKQTTIIQTSFCERVFESSQRDTISTIPCLKMYGLDIINQEGNYVPDFIESTNCILIKFDLHAPYGAPRDTLAYIPNATLRAAELLIKQAYEAKNTELILKTFNEAFTFIPITGKEYKELKSKNLQ